VSRTGHVIDSEFIEEEFISGFETVLSNSRHLPWPLEISRISQDDEHVLGYDGVLTSLVPFYVQFKRATYCRPAFNGTMAQDRIAKGLSTREGFFAFSLLKDKKSGEYLQHNALFRLSQGQRAAYVAPLFYTRQHLSAFKRLGSKWPWTYIDVDVHEAGVRRLYPMPNQRAFAKCITVPPHRVIADTEPSHHYSYLRTGSLCFHSEPEVPPSPPMLLSEFLDTVAESVFSVTDSKGPGVGMLMLLPELYGATWSNEAFRSFVKAYLLDMDLYPYSETTSVENWVFEQLRPAEILLLAERMLALDFNIIQYIVRRA
jgi:hypothetical protein